MGFLRGYIKSMNYQGVIIEESLDDKSVLQRLDILSTQIEEVTKDHQTPWLSTWTLHTVEIPEDMGEVVAEEIRKALETAHSAWYADFKNNTTHFIIFPKRVFKIDRTKVEEYKVASDYGISLGIPDYQVDFSKEVIHAFKA